MTNFNEEDIKKALEEKKLVILKESNETIDLFIPTEISESNIQETSFSKDSSISDVIRYFDSLNKNYEYEFQFLGRLSNNYSKFLVGGLSDFITKNKTQLVIKSKGKLVQL